MSDINRTRRSRPHVEPPAREPPPTSGPSWREVRGFVAHVADELGEGARRLLGLEDPKPLPPGGVKLERVRVEGPELRVLVTGDTGTGDGDQMKVAAAMTAHAARAATHFAVNLGDLVYENGVESAEDPALEARLEEPYRGLGKMYLMAGNHDHRGDVGALVDFAKTSAVAEMPARYYSFG